MLDQRVQGPSLISKANLMPCPGKLEQQPENRRGRTESGQLGESEDAIRSLAAVRGEESNCSPIGSAPNEATGGHLPRCISHQGVSKGRKRCC